MKERNKLFLLVLMVFAVNVLMAQTLKNTYVAKERSPKSETFVTETPIITEEDSVITDSTLLPESHGNIEATESSINIESANSEEDIEIIWPDYTPWTVVTLQGKLKMKGLPLSPTLKIFMQRDSLIDLSIRAPFIGEVGRLTVTPSYALMINKMNKSYVEIKGRDGTPSLFGNLGLGIGDVQDLLLGRFFLPGFDVMAADLDTLVDVYVEHSGVFNIVPKGEAEIDGVKYGFITDGFFKPLMLMVLYGENGEVDVTYNDQLKGYDMQVVYSDAARRFEANLEFQNPEWRGEMPKPMDLKKYTQLTLDEFIRTALK